MSDIAEMLARMAAERDSTPKVSHVGQIARLREFKDRLDAGNSFEVGQLVTPRRDSPVKNCGIPHLVIDLRSAEYDFTADEGGSSSFGAKFDLRVVAMQGGQHLCMHWCESVYFEPYIAEVHEKMDEEPAVA